MTPTARTARLILLLREPRTLAYLLAELEISAPQLRRDLADVRAAGWDVRERGRPKTVWIEEGGSAAT